MADWVKPLEMRVDGSCIDIPDLPTAVEYGYSWTKCIGLRAVFGFHHVSDVETEGGRAM